MAMTPAALQDWRKRLGLTAKAAAEALGLSINGYAAYERGWAAVDREYTFEKELVSWRESPRPIPRHVELACERLELLATKPCTVCGRIQPEGDCCINAGQ